MDSTKPKRKIGVRMPMLSVRIPQDVMDYYKSFPCHSTEIRRVLTQSMNVIRMGDGSNTREASEE